MAQASRDLDLRENMLREWIREMPGDPAQTFPGRWQLTLDQLESEKLRHEIAKPRTERDILKKAADFFARGAK